MENANGRVSTEKELRHCVAVLFFTSHVGCCLSAPDVLRRVVDFKIVLLVEVGACAGQACADDAAVLNLHHVHGGLAIIFFHCLVSFLFDYYFTSVIHINALHAGLAAELAAVEGEPAIGTANH